MWAWVPMHGRLAALFSICTLHIHPLQALTFLFLPDCLEPPYFSASWSKNASACLARCTQSPGKRSPEDQGHTKWSLWPTMQTLIGLGQDLYIGYALQPPHMAWACTSVCPRTQSTHARHTTHAIPALHATMHHTFSRSCTSALLPLLPAPPLLPFLHLLAKGFVGLGRCATCARQQQQQAHMQEALVIGTPAQHSSHCSKRGRSTANTGNLRTSNSKSTINKLLDSHASPPECMLLPLCTAA